MEFESYKKQEIEKNIGIVKDLKNKGGKIKFQEKEFIRLTGASRSSFYRYRKSIKTGDIRYILVGYGKGKAQIYYNQKKGKSCYFCNSKINLNIHHIDRDRKNNYKENLMVLCKSCHNKVHRLYSKLKNKNQL